MTGRTDDEIERLAARWVRGQGPADAPESLRLRLHEIVAARPAARRRPPLLLLAASLAAILGVSAAAIVGGALLLNEKAPKPSFLPSAPPSPIPSPTVSISPEPSIDPTADLPSIQFAGLVDANHGWVVGRDTFFTTADAATTWLSTPLPGPRIGQGVLGATFADADHGWLATLDSVDTRSGVFDVWRTSDAGRTWQKAVLAEGANRSDTMGAADFSVLGPDHLFVWIRGGMPSGWTSDLYESTDGGATWSGPRTSSEGVSGAAAFADATHGVVAGGARPDDLFRTTDAGHSWQTVRYPLPRGADPTLTTFAGPARFWDDRGGAIAATYSTPDLIPMLAILVTADGGGTWTVAATDIHAAPVAFVDSSHWLEITGTSIRETADAGVSWSERPMPAAPGFGTVVWMADTNDGWTVLEDAACQSSDCTSRLLAATSDGWRTVRVLTPARSGPEPIPSLSPALSPPGEPTASDVAAARQVVSDYTADLVRGDYAKAWRLLAPQAPQRGSLAAFASERKEFFASVHGKFSVTPEPAGVAPIADWLDPSNRALIDPSHAVLVQVTYPALAGNNAGWDLYVVAPGPGPNGLVLYDVR